MPNISPISFAVEISEAFILYLFS